MRGSLRERKPGTWELRVYAGQSILTGRKRWESKTVKGGRRKAEAELARMVSRVGAASGADATLDRLCSRFVELSAARGLSPTTIRGYRLKLGHVCEAIGTVKLGKLTPALLDEYYEHRLRNTAAHPTTIRHEHRVLSTALRQAVKWGWIDENPAERATPPSAPMTEIAAPSVDTVRGLIDKAAANGSDQRSLLIAFLGLTGMRRGEACALRWTAVDLDAGTVTVRRTLVEDGPRLVERWPKTRKPRVIALDELGVAILRSRWAWCVEKSAITNTTVVPDGYVWSDYTDCSEPLRPGTLSQYVRRLGDQLGVKVGAHQLRHFAATFLIAEGYDVRTVASRLGHADPSTTLRVYAHALSERDQAAAASLSRALGRGAT